MWQSAELHFALDHPATAGHFPNNPIIPGALLLDEVVATIAGEAEDSTVMLHAAKFLHLVCPGERLTLRWQSLEGGAIKFECRLAGHGSLVMTGTLEIKP